MSAHYEAIISFCQRLRHRMRRRLIAVAPCLLVCGLATLAMYRARPGADPVEAIGSVLFGVWLYRTVVSLGIRRPWLPLLVVLADCLVYHFCLRVILVVPAVLCSMACLKFPQLVMQLVTDDSTGGKTRDQLK